MCLHKHSCNTVSEYERGILPLPPAGFVVLALRARLHQAKAMCLLPQAFAQVPDLHVWYGPDSYMGANLAQLFSALAYANDEDVAALHPAHTAASIRVLLPRLHHFAEGVCIVHHMFGSEVTELVKSAYPDAHLAAHFEVRPLGLLAFLRRWLV